MNIEEIKELLKDLMGRFSKSSNAQKLLEQSKIFIDSQQSKIEELEADKLEMAKAIVDNNMANDFNFEYRKVWEYCVHCKETDGDHSKDCIVNKANKYIKEVEK